MTRNLRLLPILLSLTAAPALAQWPGGFPGFPGGSFAHAVTTSGNFAALSQLGTTSDFDSAAAGTAVSFFTSVNANVGGGFGGGFPGGGFPGGGFPGWPQADSARASSLVFLTSSANRGDGVAISESGSVRNTTATRGASAGTSADAPGTASPVQGSHAVSVSYPSIASGTTAVVSISWLGTASSGASAGATVDINGDGVADFTGVANGNRATAALQVTAGANGVVVRIVTNGNAAVAAAGNENYSANLQVSVIEGALPTSCTFTNFGAACGAALSGTVAPGLSLSLDVTNAAASTIGFLAIGGRAATPGTLPFSTCPLLIDPSLSFLGSMMFRTDAAGAASIALRTPVTALTTSFQALVWNPTATPRGIDASNGTELVCQ